MNLIKYITCVVFMSMSKAKPKKKNTQPNLIIKLFIVFIDLVVSHPFRPFSLIIKIQDTIAIEIKIIIYKLTQPNFKVCLPPIKQYREIKPPRVSITK